MTGIEHYLTLADPYVRDYGYSAVFVVLFLESLGAPLPGESTVIAGALLASRGDLHLVPFLAVVWSAAALGDNVGYAIGLFGGRRLILHYGARIGITEPRLGQAERVFRRYGGGIVMVARFFVVLRQLNGVTAGTAAMPWQRFVFYNAAGAALWTGAWGVGIYVLRQQVARLLPWLERFGYGTIIVAGIGLMTVFVIGYRRRRHRS
jgi:membrane protein DedA with SNARE-associated domain